MFSYLEEPSVISTESFGMDCFRGSLLHASTASHRSVNRGTKTNDAIETDPVQQSLAQPRPFWHLHWAREPQGTADWVCRLKNRQTRRLKLHCCRVSYNFHRSNNLLPSFTIYFSLFLTSRRSRTISNSCLLCCGDCFCGLGAIGCISLCCNWPMRIYAMAKTWHKHHIHHKIS